MNIHTLKGHLKQRKKRKKNCLTFFLQTKLHPMKFKKKNCTSHLFWHKTKKYTK